MALVDRVQRIIASPQTEWPVIALEPSTVSALYSGYIVPLAAVPAICSAVSWVLFLHFPLIPSLGFAAGFFLATLVIVFVVALIADALSPSFGGVKDQTQAVKLVAYSFTSSWVAGIAALIPFVGILISLLGSLYSLYLLYLGVVPVMRVPSDKAAGYTIVLVIISIVLVSVVQLVLRSFVTAT